MPYAFVGAGAVAPSQSGNNRTLSATFAAGETVFVIAQTWQGGPTTVLWQIADGVNTWTEVARVQSGSGSTTGASVIWKADNVAAGTVTITLSRTDSAFTGDFFNFYRYTGLAPGAVQVAGGRNFNPNGASGVDNVTGISLTPTGQPAMLLAAAWPQNAGAQPSAGALSNDRGQLSPGAHGRVEDRRLTSTAAVTPAFTTTSTFEDHEIIAIIVSEAAPASTQRSAPSSDVSNAGWSASVGGNLSAMIDEVSSSSSDFISTTQAGAQCVVALSAVTDPALSTGHIVRYRAQGDGASGLEVALLQGSTVIATWTTDPLPTVETLYERTLTAPQADAITDYSQLRLRFTEV